MLVLSAVCEKSSVLRIVYFINILKLLIFIVLPIGLIIKIILDLYKQIVSGEDIKECIKKITYKVVATIIVFLIPTIVDIFISFLSYDIKDTYKSCQENATLEKINYYGSVEEKVDKVEDLIEDVKKKPTLENLANVELAVAELYTIANGEVIEDLEYKLADIRTKATMTDEEYNCITSGGTYENGKCTHQTPTVKTKSNNGMVYYTFKSKNDYYVIDSKISVSSYVQYIKNNKICQTQSSSFRYGNQCLCFAEEYAHALVTGDKSKKAEDINKYYYSGFFNRISDDNKRVILNSIYSELINNKPVILHVNGNKNGTTRHYVTVIGFKSTVTDVNNFKETDILFIDSDDANVEQLHEWGTSRFMTTGAKCKKDDYTGYQIYMLK